jgi:hypothetical protein
MVAVPECATAIVFTIPGIFRARAEAGGVSEVAIYGDGPRCLLPAA